MKINQNSPAYKSLKIRDIEAMGVKNIFKAQPLCIQKRQMVESAIRQGFVNEADFII